MNKSKNFIKRINEKIFEKRLKKHNAERAKVYYTALPALGFIIISSIQLFFNHSFAISAELALFSLFTTLSFEINEWNIIYNKPNGKAANFFNCIPPILFAVVLLEAFAFICGFITA